MSARRGYGLLGFVALFVLVACLVFAALSASLFMTGELPAFEPRLTGLEPQPGFSFSPTTPITLTFDQPMDPASVELSFALAPPVPGTFAWNDDLTQVAFHPSSPGFEPGMRYRARLADGARAGTLPRTTRNAVEWGFALAPLLADSGPALGATGIGPQPVLSAHLNYRLDCESTSQSFGITPPVPGRIDCQEGSWSFTPSTPLAPDRAYSASLRQVYLDGDPTARPGLDWQFHTATPLLVVGVTPAVEQVVDDLWTPIRITFNRPPVPETVAGRFGVTDADGAPVQGEISWENEGTTLVFRPDAALKPLYFYRWRLDSGIQDALGFTLAETLSRRLDTGPLVGLRDPGPGVDHVPLDMPLRVTFTRSMDRASVAAGLVLTPALEGELAWEGETVVFTPVEGWRGDTEYQVRLDAGIRDASGAPLAEPLSWSFRCQPFLLEASVPAGETRRLSEPLQLHFALPMDRASVERALSVTPGTPGELTWSDGDRSLTFQPLPGWLPGTRYSISLSGTARAADRGQDLGRAQSWSFATGRASVHFGSGPNVQVVGTGGERAIELAVQGADVAGFRLYPISATQFLDLYHPGFWAEDGSQARLLDTANLTPTLEWRSALLPLEGEAAPDGWWLAQAHVPSEMPAGFYVLSAEPPAGDAGQLLVVLTGHTLLLKQALAGAPSTGRPGTAQILAWDSEIEGGTPVVSATLSLYDAQGALLATALTDEDGLAGFELGQDSDGLWVLSDRGGDQTIARLGDEWNVAGWWSWGVPPPRQPLHTIYAYTDRPIYRPGQTVHFKAVVRTGSAASSYALPAAGLAVEVRLRDARDNLVSTQVLSPTQFGTVFGEFRLADEAGPGTWQIEFDVDGATESLPIEVQEFGRPEYEVVVTTPRQAYGQGEAISVTVEARTLSGEPLPGAEVQLRGYVAPEGWYDSQGVPRFGEEFLVATGSTDDAGQWATSLVPRDVLVSPVEGRLLLALEATVTGQAGQSVSSYGTLSLHPAPHNLALLLERDLYAPDEEITFAGSLHDLGGEPLAGVELRASVVDLQNQELVVGTAVTDETGQAHFSSRFPEQGRYRLRLLEPGSAIPVEDWLWVYDPSGQTPWHVREQQSDEYLAVSAGRQEYAVGEEAIVVVQALASGPALLSLEREEVLELRPLFLVAGTNLVTLPIESRYVPNVYVKVSQLVPSQPGPLPGASRAEAQLATAGIQLQVPAQGRELSVALRPESPNPDPGEETSFQVQVTDAEGRPVVAEVSLAVVDKALAALVEDRAADPLAAFYGPQPNNVSTFDSLRPFRALYPERGMGGGEEEAVQGGTPRRSFLDTALWAPAVVTGADGQATLTLSLPDNLTTWSAVARAVTTDTRVGQATAGLVVSQEISLLPVAPRFLVEGDTFTLTVAVHNAASRPVSATVALDARGLVLEGRAVQVVHVPAGRTGLAAWALLAGSPGRAELWLRATATHSGTRVAGRDVVQLGLPIVPLALPEVTALSGSVEREEPTATLTITLPAGAVPELTRLELELAPSIAGGLLKGLDFLREYPYDGVEQTVSRVASHAAVAQALSRAGAGNELLEPDLPAVVGQGLQQLYALQHADGGWGWQPDGDSRPWQTAYVLLGLARTHQAGFEVDEGVVDRGAQALTAMLPGADLREQAYAAYALAMAGSPLTTTLTLTDALRLDPFSQAALSIAAGAAGDPGPATALLASLEQAAIQDGAAVYWETGSQATGEAMDSRVRTTALVAQALGRLDPSSPLVPGAVRWLMDQRAGGGWGDTQRTGSAILALAEYAVAGGDGGSAVEYQVNLNGAPWQAGVLEGVTATHTLVLAPVQVLSPTLLPGENRVDLVLGEGGPLYYATRLRTWRNPSRVTRSRVQSGNIALGRELRAPGSQEPLTELHVGDLVEVVLTLDVPEESWYVLVEDPLPAGLEALDDLPGRPQQPISAAAAALYERKEVHDDRVAFFFASLPPGRHTVSYLARARTAGCFATLPVQAQLMYEPEARSRSAPVTRSCLRILRH